MSSKSLAVAAAVIVGMALAATAIGASSAFQGHRHAQLTTPMMMGSFATPAASTTQWHRFRGRVTSTNRAHHWIMMRTTMRRRVQIYTDRHTYWDGCGWDDMHSGYRADVRAYRSLRHWIAARMQGWHDHSMP